MEERRRSRTLQLHRLTTETKIVVPDGTPLAFICITAFNSLFTRKKLLPCFCTAGVFVRLLRAINKLFLYQEVLKQNIGYYIRTSESPSDRQALLLPFRLFQRPFGYFPWSAHLQACPPQRYFRQGEDISCHSNAPPDAGREAR